MGKKFNLDFLNEEEKPQAEKGSTESKFNLDFLNEEQETPTISTDDLKKKGQAEVKGKAKVVQSSPSVVPLQGTGSVSPLSGGSGFLSPIEQLQGEVLDKNKQPTFQQIQQSLGKPKPTTVEQVSQEQPVDVSNLDLSTEEGVSAYLTQQQKGLTQSIAPSESTLQPTVETQQEFQKKVNTPFDVTGETQKGEKILSGLREFQSENKDVDYNKAITAEKEAYINSLDPNDPIVQEYNISKQADSLLTKENVLLYANNPYKQSTIEKLDKLRASGDKEAIATYKNELISSLRLFNETTGNHLTEAELKAIESQDVSKIAKAVDGLSELDKKAAGARVAKRDFLENKYSELNNSISKLESQLVDPNLSEQEKEAIRLEIKDKKQSKDIAFATDGKQIAKSLGVGDNNVTTFATIASQIPKDLTDKQKFDMFFIGLNRAATNAIKEAGLDTESNNFLSSTAIGLKDVVGRMSKEERDALELYHIAESMKNIYLNNNLTNGKESTLWDDFSSAFTKTLTPQLAEKSISEQRQITTQSLQDLGVSEASGFKKETLEAFARNEQLEGDKFSKQFATTAGASFGMMAQLLATRGLVGAAGKIAASGKAGTIPQDVVKLGTAIETSLGKTKKGEILLEALKEGARAELAGNIFKQSEEELNFASFAVGTAGAKSLGMGLKVLGGKNYTTFLNTLGVPAATTAKFVGSLATNSSKEVIEESLQQITQTMEKSKSMSDFVAKMNEQFPDMDAVTRFLALTATSGGIMNLPSSYTAAREVLKNKGFDVSKADAIVQDLNQEANSALRESIQQTQEEKANQETGTAPTVEAPVAQTESEEGIDLKEELVGTTTGAAKEVLKEALGDDDELQSKINDIESRRTKEIEELKAKRQFDAKNTAPINAKYDAELKSLQDEQSKNKLENRNKDLFPETTEFSSVIGKSKEDSKLSNYTEKNGVGVSSYSNSQGDVDVIMSGTSDNDYVGYVRIYENGKPTNRWTSKMSNKSGNKQDFKEMISQVQSLLPEGHEYTESTSISLDGLRVYNNQLNKGYEVLLDENGKPVTEQINVNKATLEGLQGVKTEQEASDLFEDLVVEDRTEYNAIKEKIAKLFPQVRVLPFNETSKKITIDLPVLKSTKQTQPTKPLEQSVAESIGTDVKDHPNADAKLVTIGNTEVALSSKDGVLMLENIETKEAKDKGKGSASNAMSKLLAEADKRGLQVKLRVNPNERSKGKRLDKRQLIDWYKKNGFTKIEGTQEWIREPKVAEAKTESQTEPTVSFSELTPEQKRKNQLIDLNAEFNAMNGKQQSEKKGMALRQQISKLSAELGYTQKQTETKRGGKITGITTSIVDSNGKTVGKTNQKMSIEGITQEDIDLVKQEASKGTLEQVSEGRFDIDGMTKAEINSALESIKKGNYDTTPVKKLILGLRQAKKDGGYQITRGSGNNVEKIFVPSVFAATQLEEDGMTKEEIERLNKEEAELASQYDEWYNNQENETKQQIDNDKARADKQKQPNTKGESENDVTDNKKQEGGTEEKSKLEKASDAQRTLAKKIRDGKIKRPDQLYAGTGIEALWDASLEIVATALEGTATITEAIDKAIKAMRKSNDKDYQNLTSEQKTKLEENFRNQFADELAEEKRIADEKKMTEAREAEEKAKDSEGKKEEKPKAEKKAPTPINLVDENGKQILDEEGKPVVLQIDEEMFQTENEGRTQAWDWIKDDPNISQESKDLFEKNGYINYKKVSQLGYAKAAVLLVESVKNIPGALDAMIEDIKANPFNYGVELVPNLFTAISNYLYEQGLPQEQVIRARTEFVRKLARGLVLSKTSSSTMKFILNNMSAIDGAVGLFNQRKNSFLDKETAGEKKGGKTNRQVAKETSDSIDEVIKQVLAENNIDADPELVKKIQAILDKQSKAETETEKKGDSKLKAFSAAQKAFAKKIREGKIAKPGEFYTSTGFDVAWDIALEGFAKAFEASASLTEAIDSAIKAFRKTDYYKGLDSNRKIKTEEGLKKHFASEYNKTEKELTEEEKADEASDTLAEKAINGLKEKGVKTNNEVEELIKNLYAKGRQAIPKQEKGETKESYRERLIRAMANQNFARDVWNKAKNSYEEILQAKVDKGEISSADQADILRNLQEFFGSEVGIPFSEKLAEGTIKEATVGTIKEIVKQHYSKREATGKTLVAKIIANTGLSVSQATELSELLEKKFNDLLKPKIEKELEKTFKKKKLDSKDSKLLGEIIKLINLGTLNETTFEDAFAERYGYIGLTKEDTAILGSFAYKIALYPEGSAARNKEIFRMKSYINLKNMQNQKVSRAFLESLKDIFLHNILGTASTFARNLLGLAITYPLQMAQQIFRIAQEGGFKNGKVKWEVIKKLLPEAIPVYGAVKAIKRGKSAWKDVMKENYAPEWRGVDELTHVQGKNFIDNLYDTPLSEIIKDKELKTGKKLGRIAYRALEYLPAATFRAIIATDAVMAKGSRQPLELAAAAIKVLAQTSEGTVEEKQFMEDIAKLLSKTTEQREIAKTQAKQELEAMKEAVADKPKLQKEINDFNLEQRIEEILEQSKDSEIREYTNKYSEEIRLVQEVQGTLGALLNALTPVLKNPVMGLLVPIVRVPANFINLALDYSLLTGLKRSLFGRGTLWSSKIVSEANKIKMSLGKENSLRAANIEQQKKANEARNEPNAKLMNTLIYNAVDSRIKFAMGATTFALVAAAVLANLNEDDEDDRWLEITSFGDVKNPQNNKAERLANGRKDMSYRIKIPGYGWTDWYSYAQNPLLISSFNLFGKLFDKKKYSPEDLQDKDINADLIKKEQEKIGVEAMAGTLIESMDFAYKMSFMLNIAEISKEFAEVVADDSKNKFLNYSAKVLGRTIASTVMPSQLNKIYDYTELWADAEQMKLTKAKDMGTFIPALIDNIQSRIPVWKAFGENNYDDLGQPIKVDIPYEAQGIEQAVKFVKSFLGKETLTRANDFVKDKNSVFAADVLKDIYRSKDLYKQNANTGKLEEIDDTFKANFKKAADKEYLKLLEQAKNDKETYKQLDGELLKDLFNNLRTAANNVALSKLNNKGGNMFYILKAKQ